jgi:hypothetical protein
MVSKLLSYFFLFSFSWQLLLPLPLMLDYSLRYKTYAEELCENRFDPTSNCKGSCQVSRILKGETEQSPQPEMPVFQTQKDWLLERVQNSAAQFKADVRANTFPLARFYENPGIEIVLPPPQTLVRSLR